MNVHIKLKPVASECSKFRHNIRTIAEIVGFDDESLEDLVLGINEAFSNAVKYGSCCGEDVITTTIVAAYGHVEIELRYRGDKFSHRLPKRGETSQLTNGGLGRYIMYSLFDEVSYEFNDGFTNLRIRKHCASAHSADKVA